MPKKHTVEQSDFYTTHKIELACGKDASKNVKKLVMATTVGEKSTFSWFVVVSVTNNDQHGTLTEAVNAYNDL